MCYVGQNLIEITLVRLELWSRSDSDDHVSIKRYQNFDIGKRAYISRKD